MRNGKIIAERVSWPHWMLFFAVSRPPLPADMGSNEYADHVIFYWPGFNFTMSEPCIVKIEMMLHLGKPGVSSDSRKGIVSISFSCLQEYLEKGWAGLNESKKYSPLTIGTFSLFSFVMSGVLVAHGHFSEM